LFGNINRFIRRRKNSTTATDNSSSNSSPHSNTFKEKLIIVLGIAIAVIGIAGTIYYGSQFVKEEVNGGGTFPYTTSPQIKNVSPMDLEIIFVTVMLVGFGIFTYGFVERIDKPLDFYPI
jgi:uncharacterized membrane protein YidH (DUF202 family)